MEKRIQINGDWYIRENARGNKIGNTEEDLIYGKQIIIGNFEAHICTDTYFNNIKDTLSISYYINGWDKDPDIWDNALWIKKASKGIFDEDPLDLSPVRKHDLGLLFKALHRENWI